jgi:Radical SAM superfamily/Iron-sulfur cluster-binding domain
MSIPVQVEQARDLLRDVEYLDRLARYRAHQERQRDAEVPECPLILRVEVTNVCNADCVFCAYQYQERPVERMSFELFRHVVDQYTALGGTAVNFSPVVGEALIDKELERKVAYVRRWPQYVKLELWTNAILLTRQRFEALAAAGLNDFNISMSGFSADEYRRIYRNGNYQRVYANLLAISESPALADVSFVIHAHTDSLNPLLEPDYVELHRRGVFSFSFEPGVVDWGGAIREEDLPNHMFVVHGPETQNEPCFLLWGGQTVLADGRMTMCGCTDVNGDGLPLGNAEEVAIDAHLRDGRWAEIRDSFLRGEPPEFCRGCKSYWPHTSIHS